jgi:streptogramin lyase
LVAGSHGIVLDKQGMLWFDIRNSPLAPQFVGSPHGTLARLNPNSGQVDVFTTPSDMPGPHSSVDVDPQGNVWDTTSLGAVRLNGRTFEYTSFAGPVFKNADGVSYPYGLAADGEGNGWWADNDLGYIYKVDIETGKTIPIKVPLVPGEADRVTPGERQLYSLAGNDAATSAPWMPEPRRLSADKNGDTVWVSNYAGGTLNKVDIHTLKLTTILLPKQYTNPYKTAVDNDHNVWMNMQNTDRVARYNPKTGVWTEFELPTHGTETRFISVFHQNGKLRVIVPYYRSSKVAVITFRTEQDIESLKAQVQSKSR